MMNKAISTTKLTCILCCVTPLLLPVHASDLPPQKQQADLSYPATFFAQYKPQNAREMVLRLPGFTLDEGDTDRGFGGNAGNVLINGARPTAKAGGLQAALTRLPAQQVSRIEILHGGISAGEAAGQTMVANIISSSTTTRGTWTARARKTAGTDIEPNIEATISTTLGQWQTAFDADIAANPSYRTATVEQTNQDKTLVNSYKEAYPTRTKVAIFNGAGARQIGDGTFTISGRYAADNWQADTRRNDYSGQLSDDADRLTTINEKQQQRLGELGLDYVSTTDDWKLHWLGLGLINDARYRYKYQQTDNNTNPLDLAYRQDRVKSEFVGRVTYGQVGDARLKPEFGVEVAKNKLDTDAIIATQNNPFEPVFGSNVEVEEWRGETFANFVYSASPALSVEGGVTAEFSQIKVSGDTNQKQTFRFIKPRLSTTYQFNPDTRLTFEAEREVGQLNFNDFAASSVASEQRTTAGNPALAPDHKTKITATLDWRFSERGSLKVKAFREWRKDILEQVILSTNEDGQINQGLGNAGDARTWGVITELNLPLDRVIHNGLLEVTHRFRQSHFNDSIIAGDRRISNYTPDWFKIEFRQDLDAHEFAWGLRYSGGFRYNRFLVDEIQTFGANKVLMLFAETTRFFGVKTQFKIDNVNTARYPQTREFFDPTRGQQFIGSEFSKRQNRPTYMLSFLASF